MSSQNQTKQETDEQTAKNKNVPKGTIIESKIFPSDMSGSRSNVAKVVTSVKKPIPSSSASQQVDYYLKQLSDYISWATSQKPDPLKNENSFFPSVKRIITFQSAKPEEKDVKGGKKHHKKGNTKSKKNNKTKKGSRNNKNKTRKQN